MRFPIGYTCLKQVSVILSESMLYSGMSEKFPYGTYSTCVLALICPLLRHNLYYFMLFVFYVSSYLILIFKALSHLYYLRYRYFLS